MICLNTEELLCILNSIAVRVAIRQERLADVWARLDWCKANDFRNEDLLKEALKNYRNG